MPATINGTSGFGGNLTGNVTGNADTSTVSTTATKLSTTTGDAPTYACRAWVNFNGATGSTVDGEFRCTIRESGNVSKVVRNSTGDYTITFSTAMPDANFVGHISGGGPVNTNHVIPFLGEAGANNETSHPNSSSFRFCFYEPTNSSRRGNPVMVNVAIFR
jgi:hypothetical protein